MTLMGAICFSPEMVGLIRFLTVRVFARLSPVEEYLIIGN